MLVLQWGPIWGRKRGGKRGELGPIICLRGCLKRWEGSVVVGVGESGFELVEVGGVVEGRGRKQDLRTYVEEPHTH